MRLVSTGQSLGSNLIPEGLTIHTIPHDLFMAFEHATRILDWQANLISEEMPDPWKWTLDWELESWFEKVKIDRRRKYGDGAAKPGDPDYNDEGEGMFEENIYFERIQRGEPIFE